MPATDRNKKIATAAGLLGIRCVNDKTVFRLLGQQDVPVEGARVTVDRGETARRITATRVALTGIFALALKKDTSKLFVTIEGADGSVMLHEVKAKKEGKARQFATLVNGTHVDI